MRTNSYASTNSDALERPDLRKHAEPRVVNMNRIGEALLEAEQPIGH